MTTEIEIKFIATPEAAMQLPAQLATWSHQHTSPVALTNRYFDTPDRQLCQWKMALRIRGDEQHYEMTLKGAGQTSGGVHQRPEYNVALSEPVIDLARLPADIWPQGCDVSALQKRLQPLFTTDFQREIWLIRYGQSDIEVALDRGEVSADGQRETLLEMELELKHGERADLLSFAAELIQKQKEGLRLSHISKAARGYWLAAGKPEQPLRPLPVLRVKPKASVEEGMQAAFMLALAQWQYHEELWLRDEAEAIKGITEALETLQQIFTLFGGLIPRKASNELRQKLTALSALLTTETTPAAALCYSALWLDAQFSLVSWLLNDAWRPFVDEKDVTKLQGSFKRFADIMLGRTAADLKQLFRTIRQPNEFHDKTVRLVRQFRVIPLLAGAYPLKDINAWLVVWQQLLEAIDGDRLREADELRRQALLQPAFWLSNNQPCH